MRIALVLACACLGWAQTGAGRIQGSVKDATGAVVPGSQVTALQVETGLSYDTRANDAGFYAFPSLQPGRYRMTVRSAGMQSWEGEMILQTGQVAGVDISLKLGATTTEITVAGDVTPLVETANATLGTVLEHQRVEQLPLNGRALMTLIEMTTPGAEGGRVYGARRDTLEVVQDGASMFNMRFGGLQGRPPGLDTVDEFRVETNNASARSNRPVKAIAKTKSGTNQFHGALFETARNNGLGLARARQDYYDRAPTLIRNEFGASAGGPVTLPKLYDGRNRTFVFGAYERYALRQYSTFSTAVIPAAMREGDFSGLVDGAGRAYTLYDPWSSNAAWSRTPYPDNRIPSALRSPLAAYMFKVTPLATMPGVNPLVSDNFFAPAPNNRDDHTGTLRIDHRLSSGNQIFFRYSQGIREELSTNSADSPITLDHSTNYKVVSSDTRAYSMSWTRLFSPTLFSETLLNYGRDAAANITGDQSKDYLNQFGLPNPFGRPGFPEMNSTGFGTNTSERNNTYQYKTRIWNLEQNMTKMRGRHQFEFGGLARMNKLNLRPQEQYVRGYYQFNSMATSLYDRASGSRYAAVARTGHNAANFFLGIPGASRIVKTRPWFNLSGPEYSGYIQDNFKVTPRLTVNIGVRIESFPVLREVDNMLTGFDPKSQAIVIGQPVEQLYKLGASNPAIIKAYTDLGVRFITPQQAGLPERGCNTDLANWEPRLGFAYRLTPGTRPIVLRGGFSRFALPIPLDGYQARARNNAPLNVNFPYNPNDATQSPDGISNYLLRSAPNYVVGKNAQNMISASNPVLGGLGSVGVSYYDPYQPITKMDQWNLTLEREMLRNTVLRVALVGNRTFDLDQMYGYNEPMPDYIWFVKTGQPLPQGATSGVARRPLSSEPYGKLEIQQKTGWANFNGFQIEVERRFSHGLAFQAFYVTGNARRAGGNDWRDDLMYDPYMYLDGAVPKDFHARNRLLNYHLDPDIPKHHVRWNWVADLPLGRGKTLFHNAGTWANRLVGGWQLAGQGNLRSRYWALPTDYWGYLGNIETYGKKYPIQDCRGGECIPGYLYFNGYIPANRINSYDAKGKPNGVMGVPSDYKPAFLPIVPMPAGGGDPNSPNYQYLDTNTAFLTLKNGTVQPVTPDTGMHPWNNQYRLGPMLWTMDASLFKAVSITERVRMRFNADFFNVLNMPGIGLPGSNSGILSRQNSANSPRQLQLTLRLMW